MDRLEVAKAAVSACSDEERKLLFAWLRSTTAIHNLEKDWNVTAEVVLEAIARSSELTRRMFRGILAEAAFKVEVVDRLVGWSDITPAALSAFDFKVEKENVAVTIQVKLQRKVNQEPLLASDAGVGRTDQYVVEVQKTRAGVDRTTQQSTRPYRFGEFDILAVAMEPATHDWSQFRFTLGRWLAPRPQDATLVAIYQPVSLAPDNDWTDSLETCIAWFLSGENKTIANTVSSRRRRGRG